MGTGTVVVVGGTQGLGRELAQAYADEGRDVVVTGRDQARAETAAGEIGGGTRGIGFDLAEPQTIAERLAEVGDVDYVVLAAIERDTNSVADYDIAGALRLVTLKLVGYTEVVHALLPRLRPDAAIPIDLRKSITQSPPVSVCRSRSSRDPGCGCRAIPRRRSCVPGSGCRRA